MPWVKTVRSLDPNDRFILKRCAGYLARLLHRYPLIDPDTLGLAQWVLKEDIHELERFVLDHLTGERKAKLQNAVDDANDDVETYIYTLTKGLEILPGPIQDRAVQRLVVLLKQKAAPQDPTDRSWGRV